MEGLRSGAWLAGILLLWMCAVFGLVSLRDMLHHSTPFWQTNHPEIAFVVDGGLWMVQLAVGLLGGAMVVRGLTGLVAPTVFDRVNRASRAKVLVSFALILLSAILGPFLADFVIAMLPTPQFEVWLSGLLASVPGPMRYVSEQFYFALLVMTTPFIVIGAFWTATSALADETPLRTALRLTVRNWWLVLGVSIVLPILQIWVIPHLIGSVASWVMAVGLFDWVAPVTSVADSAALLALVTLVAVLPDLRRRAVSHSHS